MNYSLKVQTTVGNTTFLYVENKYRMGNVDNNHIHILFVYVLGIEITFWSILLLRFILNRMKKINIGEKHLSINTLPILDVF